MIKTFDQEIAASMKSTMNETNENEEAVIAKLKMIEEKYKEKTHEQMLSILISGINEQLQYENSNQVFNTNAVKAVKDEEIEEINDFFDI